MMRNPDEMVVLRLLFLVLVRRCLGGLVVCFFPLLGIEFLSNLSSTHPYVSMDLGR
jgi:hypothetical protein